ncbi:MAG: carbohydrate-binding domain-containing protein [Lachnospiraceae bacterium]|nr:carbohydrate-binding domain-containing protein [Lachnospiraceae bacterium]
MKYKNIRQRLKNIGIMMTVCAVTLTGCASASSKNASESGVESAVETEANTAEQTAASAGTSDVTGSTIDASDQFTDRDLDWSYDESEAIAVTLSDGGSTASDDSVQIDGDTLTITKEGVYVISGSLKNGQIQVNTADDENAKVQIVLNGVNITNESSACIYVIEADKTFITTAEGTENSLSTTGEYVAIDDNNIDGVIYSKDDLVLNGDGVLNIEGPTGHGVVSKDDLKVTGGEVIVNSSDHALAGKDSVRITGATLNLTTNEDGIHSGNNDNEDETAGYIYVADGNITINAGDDGMHADLETRIDGGNISVAKSYEGIEGQIVVISGGEIAVTSSDDGVNAGGGADSSGETSGFGGGKDMFSATNEDCHIYIYGGLLSVNSQGDGLDSNGYLTMADGTVTVDGPSNDGNGALDFGDGCNGTISGGTIIATGMSGMAETFSSESTQASVMVNLESAVSGEVTLTDSNGNVLASLTPTKSYNSVVISSPDLTDGETYTLKTGDTETEVTLEGTSTTVGQAGMNGRGGRGKMGGGPSENSGDASENMGERPENMPEPPEDNGERPEDMGQPPEKPDGQDGENGPGPMGGGKFDGERPERPDDTTNESESTL